MVGRWCGLGVTVAMLTTTVGCWQTGSRKVYVSGFVTQPNTLLEDGDRVAVGTPLMFCAATQRRLTSVIPLPIPGAGLNETFGENIQVERVGVKVDGAALTVTDGCASYTPTKAGPLEVLVSGAVDGIGGAGTATFEVVPSGTWAFQAPGKTFLVGEQVRLTGVFRDQTGVVHGPAPAWWKDVYCDPSGCRGTWTVGTAPPPELDVTVLPKASDVVVDLVQQRGAPAVSAWVIVGDRRVRDRVTVKVTTPRVCTTSIGPDTGSEGATQTSIGEIPLRLKENPPGTSCELEVVVEAAGTPYPTTATLDLAAEPSCEDIDAHAATRFQRAAALVPAEERRETAPQRGTLADVDGDGRPEETRIVNVEGANSYATHLVYLSNSGCSRFAGEVAGGPDPAYLEVHEGIVFGFVKDGCAGLAGSLVEYVLGADGRLSPRGQHLCSCPEDAPDDAAPREERHPRCPS